MSTEATPADATVNEDKTPVVEPTTDDTNEVINPDSNSNEAPVVSDEADESKPISPDTLKKVRSEAQSLRQRLRHQEAESTKKAELLAKKEQLLSDRDNRINELESQLREITVQSTFKTVLTDPALGVKNADAVLRLIDRDSLTINDDNSIDGLDEEIARVKKEVPELFTVGGLDAAAGFGDSYQTPDANNWLRNMAKSI